jgi:septal ring factor EnvC (AmiA/AmiB activator)
MGVVPAIGQGRAGAAGAASTAKKVKASPRASPQGFKHGSAKLRHLNPKPKQVKPAPAKRTPAQLKPAPGHEKPAAAPRGDLKGEQRRLEQTQKQLQDERAKAAQARRREGSVLAELEEVGRRLAEKQREVAQLDRSVRRTQGDVAALQRDIATLEGRRARQEALLARRLQAIYKVETEGGAVPVLLSGQDPVARATAVRHLASLATVEARIIREYRETSDELADSKRREEERQRELTAFRAAARREQTEVDREAARRRVLLAKVRDERAHHERAVGDLTEASERLEALIREIQARQRQAELQARQRQAARVVPPKSPPAAGTPPSSGTPPATVTPAPAVIALAPTRGRLFWPTAGKVTAGFGAQVHPRFGTRTFRNGVDIEAAEGTGIEAVLAGQVVYTGWFKGYGNLIIIDHGDELFTLYAHVSEIHVKEGDSVRQGQRIGAVGDTGSLSGPRLYFEVRYRGKPQDPEQWLRQRG